MFELFCAAEVIQQVLVRCLHAGHCARNGVALSFQYSTVNWLSKHVLLEYLLRLLGYIHKQYIFGKVAIAL